MIKRTMVAAFAMLLLVLPTAQGQQLKEIFYAPFDGSPDAVIARGQAAPYQARVSRYIAGVKGQAVESVGHYNGIRWDGRGNIDLERGTLSLFYSPADEPGPAQRDSLFGVSTDIEGYWAGIVNFLNMKGQDRAAKPAFGLRFYNINRYSPDLRFEPIFGRWHKGQWHHLAMVWDRHYGITIYEDGKRVDSNWGSYRWDWNFPPRMLVLGGWVYSTTPFAADEMRIYADCLTDAQIAQLSRCETPSGAALAPMPFEQSRPLDLARMGWTDKDLPTLAAAAPERPLRLSFARVSHAIDAKRRVAQPIEGLPGSCWPIQKYGPSTAGALLEIHLAPDQQFDRVRIFSHGPFAGTLAVPLGKQKEEQLLTINSPRPVWHGQVSSLRRDEVLHLHRAAGQTGVTDFQRTLGSEPHSIGQIDLYRAETGVSLPKKLREYRGLTKLERLPDTLTARAVLGDTPAALDNPVLATMDKTAKWKSVTPAFGGFQVITETLAQPLAMDGVIVRLVVEGLSGPTPVHIAVKEPILPQRDWLAADVLLTPKGRGKQTFIIHLTGRPIISFPQTELAIARKRTISDPGRELAVLVTAASSATWHMGDGGCGISLCLADERAALPAAIADQIEFAREAYAEHNEGHIWDVMNPPGWGRLYYPLLWLMRFAPEERPTLELALRVGYRLEPVPFVEPVPDGKAPAWAFWQREAFASCKSILHWIIQNRGVETGEFGGVWGDDTDMVEYWTQDALAGDDDGTIGNALRRFWPGLYRDCLKDGVSAAVRDNLHSYEEGMGAIAHQLLLDYGDPSALERVMRASSHYEQWMAKNPDGTRRFLGNYLGFPGVWTEGAFGNDQTRNSLMFIPAGYLIWYNRHPTAADYLTSWQHATAIPGIVADAALRLKGDQAAMKKWYEEQTEKAIKDGRYLHTINCLIDQAGLTDEQKPRSLANSNRVFKFLDGALPEYAGYSPVMTEAFWMAYRASGDVKYLVTSYQQACRFINNQTWLYTVAQPSTDRIPLPDTSVIRARLGAFVTERGGHANTWPMHGLSYVRGADDVAALVTRNDEAHLAVRLYSFAAGEHELGIRLWRLWPGSYKLTLAADSNDDGQGEAVLAERVITVDRGAFVDLKLPAGQPVVLTIDAIENHAPDLNLPDAALGVDDVAMADDGRILITVHNVGVQPVKDLVVRVTDAAGQVISQQTIEQLAAPLDFQAKTAVIAVPDLRDSMAFPLTIAIDPDAKHPDLNRYNNTLVYSPRSENRR